MIKLHKYDMLTIMRLHIKKGIFKTYIGGFMYETYHPEADRGGHFPCGGGFAYGCPARGDNDGFGSEYLLEV
jgi:hypothetical protein